MAAVVVVIDDYYLMVAVGKSWVVAFQVVASYREGPYQLICMMLMNRD